MTNFQGGVSRPVTREQVLLWSPILLGVVLSIATGGLLLLPAIQQLHRHQNQLDDLKEQEARVPLLRQQLGKQIENLDLAQQKQRQILQLIAGSGDISTFMSQLGQEARKSGVQLDSYEPLAQTASQEPETKSAGKSSEGKPDPSQPPTPPPDPLLAPGLQKTTLLISAQGTGLQLQDFLRRMEQLSLLVVQSDLSLQMATPGKGTQPTVTPSGPTTLKLSLSLYSKAPAGAKAKKSDAVPTQAPAKS